MNEPSEKYHFKPHELTMKPLSPSRMGLQLISAQRLNVAGSVLVDSGEEEVCLVCLHSNLKFDAPSISGSACAKDMLYLPRHTSVQLQASSEAVVMRFGAPADSDTCFAHLPYATINSDPARHQTYGKREANCRRDVWDFIGSNFPARRANGGALPRRNGRLDRLATP
jgi:5-deoxy-glucuronate isomerase